ncbi:MAG: hypothetical protein LAT76_02530 [Schleiferiaceae bacterium]|nr:hypothetical protein [Schleiferiaceae bacterium]
MVIKNTTAVFFFKFLAWFALIGILVDYGMNLIPGTLSDLMPGYTFSMYMVGIYVLLLFLGCNSFTFKDDYEILLIHSKRFLWPGNWGSAHIYHEFPKRKLLDYKVVTFLGVFKYIRLFLDSKEGEKRTSAINLTFVADSSCDKMIAVLQQVKEDNQNKKNSL